MAHSRSPISVQMSTSLETQPAATIGPLIQPAVRFAAVSLKRGSTETVLRGASFALAPASFHGLTGPPGAGKLAVLRLIALAEFATGGTVQLFGRDAATLSRRERMAARRRIGAVIEPVRSLGHLSVWDNVALPARAVGRSEAAFAGEVDALLKWVGLVHYADASPAVLDAAQRHRLALARALVNRPEIVLVDDPAQQTDRAEAVRVLKLLSALAAAGATVLAVSHDESLFAGVGAPILRLKAGRISASEAEPA